jgi:TonB family protein
MQSPAQSWLPIRVESLEYPSLGVQSRTQGEVIVDCEISEQGIVSEAHIISGHNLFQKAVLMNVRKWRFARRELGKKSSSIRLTYEFRIEGVTFGYPRHSFIYEFPYKVILISEAPHLQPATDRKK